MDTFAKRPQVQEFLTTQIIEALVTHLKPHGAIVVIECEHLCMSMRGGIRKPGAKTVTSAVRGQLHDPATRPKPPASYSDGELRPSVCMALSPNWNSHL